jgi:hypothetical protein
MDSLSLMRLHLVLVNKIDVVCSDVYKDIRSIFFVPGEQNYSSERAT